MENGWSWVFEKTPPTRFYFSKKNYKFLFSRNRERDIGKEKKAKKEQEKGLWILSYGLVLLVCRRGRFHFSLHFPPLFPKT